MAFCHPKNMVHDLFKQKCFAKNAVCESSDCCSSIMAVQGVARSKYVWDQSFQSSFSSSK